MRRPILLALLCAAMAAPAFCAGGHYPISAEQIAATVAGGGVQVSAGQVSMLADIFATVPEPALRLASVQQVAEHLLVARIECADSAQCLPFMVALHADAKSLPAAAIHPEPPAQASRAAAPLVHSGSTATLLLDGPHVHISIQVLCLENGSLGQTVRASNPDRSQFYTAEVAGDRLLRGRL